MKPVLLKISDSDIKALDDISKKRGCFRSDLLRNMIKGFIDSADVVPDNDIKELEQTNKNLMIMLQALESKNNAIIDSYREQCAMITSSKKESDFHYDKQISFLEAKINELKNEMDSKDMSIAGLRAFIARVKNSFLARLFLPI